MPNQNPFDDNDELSGLARDIVRELKATSDLVVDAAKLGKDELLHYVSESIRSSWINSADPNKPREARTHYTEEFKKQQQAFDERRAERKVKEEKKPASSKKAKKQKQKINLVGKSAPLWFLGGGMFLIPAVVSLAEGIFGAGGSPAEILVPAGISALLAAFPLWKGFSKRKLEKLYDRYRSVVGSSPRVRLETLAALTHRSYGEAVKDVSDMVERGYFGSEAVFDSKKGVLIVDPDAPEEEEAPVSSAPVGDEPTESYEAMLLELRLLNERIEDEEMSNRIYRIEAVAKATFLAVREKPEKQSQIQRFMDYYLPTTIKLLSAYADFEKQTVEGENIRKSKENIERMTQTLSEAFEKQFDSLFKAESLDINAEIRTMDSLLRQDGYVGGFQMPSSK